VRPVIVAAALAALLALAGTALAQSLANPLRPGLPLSPAAQPTTTTTPTVTNTTTPSSGQSGLSGTGAVAIGIGAIALIGGIGFFIWRDARRRAPVRKTAAAAPAGAGDSGRTGSKPRSKPRKLSPAERRRRKRGRAR